MEVHNNTPCINNAVVSMAGCTNDGLVYVAAIDPVTYDMNLGVHSGVQEKWHLLTTKKVALAQEIGQRYPCIMSAALTHDKNCVDVFLEAAESTGYLFRFFVSSPKENCIYKCIDTEKIQFDHFSGFDLHWLGDDCLLLVGKPRNEARFLIWRIDVDKESMAFTLTNLLVYDMESLYEIISVCAGQNFLYVFNIPPGQIKVHEKSHDGTVTLCNEVPISHIISECPFMCAYPSTDGQRLLLRGAEHCHMFDCQLQSFQRMFTLDGDGFNGDVCFYTDEKLCTASSAQFFWLQANGMIDQKCIGMPSLQYTCLRKLCETWPALKTCGEEQEAQKLGIPSTIWNRFFKPL